MTIRSFIFALFAWLIIGALHALSRYSDMVTFNPNYVYSFSETGLYMLSYSLWIVITLVLLNVLKKASYPFTLKPLLSAFFLGLIIWLPTFFVIEASLSLAIFNGDFSTLGDKLSKLGNSVIFFYAIIYTLTFAACVGIVLTEKTRISNKLNQELKQRQTEDALALSKQSMQLMQSQLSPHFLFNCLGAISGLARNGQTDALVDATARVGDLLRFTISNSSSSFISLDEELAFIQDYITLQKLRFAERFNYTCNINLPDQPVLCPPFSIQPLIENVFCHAVEAQDETTEVNLIISYGCEHISIIVRNSAAANPTEIQSNGTGIQNLRCRLTHLYGTEFNLVLSQNESEFSAELLLPLKSQTHMNRVFDNV